MREVGWCVNVQHVMRCSTTAQGLYGFCLNAWLLLAMESTTLIGEASMVTYLFKIIAISEMCDCIICQEVTLIDSLSDAYNI